MKISVVIPAYNASATIDAAVESVLAQTVAPGEILVMDDGSTDDTFRHLDAFQPRIRVLRQANRGVAHARNVLCKEATGEVIAFLDADDIWHPRYLESQYASLKAFPGASAVFAGHINFQGASFIWGNPPAAAPLPDYQLIEPERFVELYNRCPGPFGSMSFCCIPKRVLTQMGPAPFPVELTGAEDFFLMNVLPFFGPVAHTSLPLVAYRETPGSLSSNRLETVGVAVRAFEHLVGLHESAPKRRYAKPFRRAFASKRRHYAKLLMGSGKASEARAQLKTSLTSPGGPISLMKSFGLLLCTCLPAPFHPRWPASHRPLKPLAAAIK
jgi:glycosyltransferase involved in cell wall biosynthesis